jgi:ketosteroid isomerase-like protein
MAGRVEDRLRELGIGPVPRLVVAAMMVVLLRASAAATEPTPAPTPQPSIQLPPELARVLTDYESAWRARDAAALARLFAEGGFVLSTDRLPVRGRAAIEKHYAGAGGPLSLRAFSYATEGRVGYILGGFARREGEADIGKFTLTLSKGADGRWLIFSDMDNGNQR